MARASVCKERVLLADVLGGAFVPVVPCVDGGIFIAFQSSEWHIMAAGGRHAIPTGKTFLYMHFFFVALRPQRLVSSTWRIRGKVSRTVLTSNPRHF